MLPVPMMATVWFFSTIEKEGDEEEGNVPAALQRDPLRPVKNPSDRGSRAEDLGDGYGREVG